MATLQLLIIITTSFLLASCGQQPNDKVVQQMPTSVYIDTLDDTGKIVDEIKKGNSVESSHIGEAGEPSEQWGKYEQLKKNATIDQLINLTDHQNPAVRCYAFQSLAARHSDKVFQILLKHLSDTAYVKTQSGCIVLNIYAGDYFVDVVTPGYVENDIYKLRKNERKILDSILVNDKSVLITSRP